MTHRRTRALILGSGPAGLFAADALLQAGITHVTIVERGHRMGRRTCPPGPGCACRPCDVLEGEGGAGSFSDGKITLSATRGTHTEALFTDVQVALLDIVGATIRRHVSHAVDYAPVAELTALAGHENLRGESYPLLHIGSDGVREFGARYSAHLQACGVTLLTGVEVTRLILSDGAARGAHLTDRHGTQIAIEADVVVAAVGMAGTPWLEGQLRGVGVALATGPADIGIRLETSAAALEPLIGQFYDFKATHTSPRGVRVRSFCVNGHGFIVNEYHRPLGVRGVNGHSFLNTRSALSNLAILATIDTTFTPDPKAYVRTLARRINDTADGHPVRQTLADFLPAAVTGEPIGFEPSNPKSRPGHLASVLPTAIRDAFASYITALGEALPAVLAPDTMLYAPEIKYYNYRVPIDPDTWRCRGLAGLYVVGNAAGYTASLSAAAVSGLIAGQAAARQLSPTPAR